MCSFGAFGLMSLSLSRQLQLGFEEGIFNFSFGSLLALLMKMNFKLAPLAATLCYVIIHIRSFSDYFMEKLGRVGSSDTAHEDIESGSRTIHSQPMNAPEHSLHNGISATPEVDTYLTEDENDNLLMLGNRWTLERNRASHKRPNMEAKDDLKAEATSLRLGKEPSTHECSICRLEFWTRQALGGHMRKHEAALHNDTNQVVTKVPVLKRSNSIEVQCLDLNLTPLQNDLNSWFANRDPVFT